MSDYLQKSYDRAIRDLANAEARIKELETENQRLRDDGDRYIWLMAHMGKVEAKAVMWKPSKDKPLLVYLQDFIDSEIPKAGDGWVDRQRALLGGGNE